jgi:hypothetical protein
VEVFGDNGKGERFKTCDACREKDRTQKRKTKTEAKQPEEPKEGEAELTRQLALIKDDTVCDVTNARLCITKLSRFVGDSSCSIRRSDKTDAIKGHSIDFDEKGYRMFLAFGDTWKRTHKFLDLPLQADLTCPICLEELTHKKNANSLTCHECLIGVCGDCTIKQFIVNRGVMVCCNCRHSISEPKPAYQVAGMAEAMLRGLTCGFRD